MDLRSWVKKILFRALIALLPFGFLHLTYLFFKIPVWDLALPVSALVSGIATVFVVAVLVKRHFTARVDTEPDKAKKYLLYLAFITGFSFPLVLFTLAGLIYMVRAGMPLSQGLEMGWVSFVAGAAWGWSLWLFSVPWAFVMVYWLAGADSGQRTAEVKAP